MFWRIFGANDQCDQIRKIYILRIYLVLGKILNLFGQKIANGQFLKAKYW